VSNAALDVDPHAFSLSMPSTYAEAFDQRAISEHARIVEAKGSRLVHAELWRMLPQGIAIVAVVARDRPGLLATISTAFVLHRLNITTALVYSRTGRDGQPEAFDLFWVRRRDHRRGQSAAPSSDDLELCIKTLTGFVQAEVDPAVLLPGPIPPPMPGPAPRVCFETTGTSAVPTLVVEAPDGPGLLMAIARALYRCQVTIVASDIKTNGTLAHDRFVLAGEMHELRDPYWQDQICRTLVDAIAQWQRQSGLLMPSQA
jgi:UTP:GlnB (protein PII) uridylyltransferase